MSGICKQVIRALKAGAVNSLVIGIIINSLNIKIFDATRTRFNNGERAVWTFTLRDSEEDFINVTVWGAVGFVQNLVDTFHIGTVVEVINAKIIARQPDDRDEMFVPFASSPYKLILNEGTALIQKHDTPTQRVYEELLAIPTRSTDRLQHLKDILQQIDHLRDQYIDILVVVTFVGGERNIITRDGRTLKCRNFEAADGSNDLPILLMLWESEWVERAATWQPKYTVLLLTDARIILDKFKKKTAISIVRRTLITENPNIPETAIVRKAVGHFDRDVPSRDSFAVPNPDTIVTVMTIEEISERLNQKIGIEDGRYQFATIVKAIVTDMNVDDTSPGLITTRCALCKKPVVENRDSCMNLECPCGNGTRTPFNVTSINVKVNLKDDTGYLIGCRLMGEAAERAFGCTAAEFQAMKVEQRADLKWKYILEKCDVRLHVFGPSSLFSRALYNILSIKPIIEGGTLQVEAEKAGDFEDVTEAIGGGAPEVLHRMEEEANTKGEQEVVEKQLDSSPNPDDQLACSLYLSCASVPRGQDHRDQDGETLRSRLEEAIGASEPLGTWHVAETSCGFIATFDREADMDNLLQRCDLTCIFEGPVQVVRFSARDSRYRQAVLLRDVPWAIPLQDLSSALTKQGIETGIIERSRQYIRVEVLDADHYEILLRQGLDFFGAARFSAIPERWWRPGTGNAALPPVPTGGFPAGYPMETSNLHQGDGVLQCYRCQGFWHVAANCRHLPRCVRCGEPHSVEFCPRPRNSPICCHCSGPHHAGYRQCPVRLQLSNATPISITLTTARAEGQYPTSPASKSTASAQGLQALQSNQS